MTTKWFALIIAVLALIASAGFAQGRGGMRRYDPKTETTIKGAIQDVQEISGTRGGWTGIHLLMKTDAGDVDVHVGPSSYVSEKQFSFAKGDTVEVVGSKVSIEGKEAKRSSWRARSQKMARLSCCATPRAFHCGRAAGAVTEVEAIQAEEHATVLLKFGPIAPASG